MCYEYPFNERIRVYLRLEYLLDRLFFFSLAVHPHNHQIAISTLFDILEMGERSDLKASLSQDLERQKTALIALQKHPHVAQDKLETALSIIEKALTSLTANGKIGQPLRDNKWLGSLRSRMTVSSGSSQIDMPSYYAWQHKPDSLRLETLQLWTAPLIPLHEGLQIILKLLRESAALTPLIAQKGSYQQMLSGRVFQLARVEINPDTGIFPEISGNKHMIGIRFFNQDHALKPQPVLFEVKFNLALCGS